VGRQVTQRLQKLWLCNRALGAPILARLLILCWQLCCELGVVWMWNKCKGVMLQWPHLPHRELQAQASAAAWQSGQQALPFTENLPEGACLSAPRSFSPGTNPAVRPMAHLWEPLRVMPKPLAVPLFSEAGGALTRFLLRRQVGSSLLPEPYQVVALSAHEICMLMCFLLRRQVRGGQRRKFFKNVL
jgi:hypothetical protein